MDLLHLARPVARKSSLFIFLVLCLGAFGFAWGGAIFFPNQRIKVHLSRMALTVIGVSVLIIGIKWVFRRDGFHADAFGLTLSRAHASGFFLGIAGGVVLTGLIMAVLWLQVPFHWQHGALAIPMPCFLPTPISGETSQQNFFSMDMH